MTSFIHGAEFLHQVLRDELPPTIESHRDGVKYAVERLRSAAEGPMSVLDEVAAERQRQIGKGYDAAHDDRHDDGMLGGAAGLIALGSPDYIDDYNSAPDVAHHVFGKYSDDRRRQLIISAAMIVAEIERLDRASTPK